MDEAERTTLVQLLHIASDDELVYRARHSAVVMLRTRFRGRYQKMLNATERLGLIEDACRARGLQPYDGGWYELTAPTELGRWL